MSSAGSRGSAPKIGSHQILTSSLASRQTLLPLNHHRHLQSRQTPLLSARPPRPPSISPPLDARMFARSKIARGLPQCCTKIAPQSRGLAAQASSPFHYTVADAGGVKTASRDDGGPTTSLAVVVRGGSRYQTTPGAAHGLAQFAFKVGEGRISRVGCNQ